MSTAISEQEVIFERGEIAVQRKAEPILKSKKILVTGGYGFIGSNFIRFLIKNYPKRYEIVNIDKLTYAGNPANLIDISGELEKHNYKFIHGDICDEEVVREAMYGVNDIVNFAAESHVDRSLENDLPFFGTNVEGVKTLLKVASENKNTIEKIIHVSTDEVYGSLGKEQRSSRETDALNPTQGNPYAVSKARADEWALKFSEECELPLCITRSCNNYGRFQHPEKFIPMSITELLSGRNILVYGDGKNIREWIYVEDNCEAIHKVLEKGGIGQIYNIGSAERVENSALAYDICNKMGMSTFDRITKVSDRKAHDFRYALDSSKTKIVLGWLPKVSLNEGLEETIEWYERNGSWWRPLKNEVGR